MEYRGMRYELVQTGNPAGWKWVVHLNSVRMQSGFSSDKQLAIFAAMHAINKAINGKKKGLLR